MAAKSNSTVFSSDIRYLGANGRMNEHLKVTGLYLYFLALATFFSQLPLCVFISGFVAVGLHSSPLDDILAQREILNVQTRGRQVITLDYEGVTLLTN